MFLNHILEKVTWKQFELSRSFFDAGPKKHLEQVGCHSLWLLPSASDLPTSAGQQQKLLTVTVQTLPNDPGGKITPS